jgi:hypothetical protein
MSLLRCLLSILKMKRQKKARTDHVNLPAAPPTSPKVPNHKPFAFQQLRGAVIGLGDRALKDKACVPWNGRTTDLTPARDCPPKPHALKPSRRAGRQTLRVNAQGSRTRRFKFHPGSQCPSSLKAIDTVTGLGFAPILQTIPEAPQLKLAR